METNKTRRTLAEFQRQHLKEQTFLQSLHELKNDKLQLDELSTIKTKISSSVCRQRNVFQSRYFLRDTFDL